MRPRQVNLQSNTIEHTSLVLKTNKISKYFRITCLYLLNTILLTFSLFAFGSFLSSYQLIQNICTLSKTFFDLVELVQTSEACSENRLTQKVGGKVTRWWHMQAVCTADHPVPGAGRAAADLHTAVKVTCALWEVGGSGHWFSLVVWVLHLTSLQHLKSYQDRHWLVTVCTHDDLIVLPHWKIRLPAPWPNIPLSHIVLTLN